MSSAGAAAVFRWDIDRTFWEVLSVDHLELLRNAVTWATDEEPPVIVAGPGVLDVTVWQQTNSLTVHLVNLTNPMMMKGRIRELIPLGEQTVRLRCPAGRRVKKVWLLAADQVPRTDYSSEYLHVTVPSILDHTSRTCCVKSSRARNRKVSPITTGAGWGATVSAIAQTARVSSGKDSTSRFPASGTGTTLFTAIGSGEIMIGGKAVVANPPA